MEEEDIVLVAKELLSEKESAESKECSSHWPRKDRSQWLITLMASTASIYVTRIIMPLCEPTLALDMGWNKRESGLVLSSFFWGYLITQIPGGFLSDVYGAERLLLWAVTGCSLSTLVIPLVASQKVTSPITLVLISRLALGVFQGIYYPSLYSLLAKSLPISERSSCSAFALAGGPVGSLVIGGLGSLVLARCGWRWVFLSFGSIGLLWAVLWKKIFIDHNSQMNPTYSPSHTKSEQSSARKNVPWGKIISEPAIWAVVIVHFCHNCMYFTLISWMPTYFHENFPESQGWVFNVVPYIGNFVGKLGGGYVADKMIKMGFSVAFTRKFLETLGTCVPALVLLSTSQAVHFWQALVCMSMALCLCGASTSGSLMNIQDLSPGFAGSISGVVFTISAIPGVLGVYATGYILHVTNSWTTVFQLTAVICTAGCAVYNVFAKGHKIL
ncbi:predicted protein [Nematostella vectensis]|uniref:Major facilitator superfamily (MFS) profile domain-containing protein n=2 Tax=Nematostella vectensis TaxID=45351 RepID=A7RPL5_NEMVE|nr:predicted protein [Nematostella vectensis]|eukprot:XP_001638592.1 predicted protein [Nematostella vectensis]